MAMFSVACVVVLVIAGAANGSPAGVDKCSQCKTMLESVNTMVSGDMRDRLLIAVCEALHGIRSDQCSILANLSPEQLCQELAQCESAIDIDSDTSTETELSESQREGLPCTLCKNAMKIAAVFLRYNGHMNFILRTMKSVCNFVPLYKVECLQLVNTYGRLLIYLLPHYINPMACKKLNICPAGRMAVSGDDCKVCELGIGVLYDTLEDPNLEARIQQYTESLCTGLAGNDVVCNSVSQEVTQYLSAVAEELRHSTFLKNACQRANICPEDDNEELTFE